VGDCACGNRWALETKITVKKKKQQKKTHKNKTQNKSGTMAGSGKGMRVAGGWLVVCVGGGGGGGFGKILSDAGNCEHYLVEMRKGKRGDSLTPRRGSY